MDRFAALFTIQTPALENFSQLELRCRASGSFHIAGYTVYRGAITASCRSMMDYCMTAGQIPKWPRSMILWRKCTVWQYVTCAASAGDGGWLQLGRVRVGAVRARGGGLQHHQHRRWVPREGADGQLTWDWRLEIHTQFSTNAEHGTKNHIKPILQILHFLKMILSPKTPVSSHYVL